MGVAGRGATRPGVACDRLGEAGKVIQIPEVIGIEEGYPVPARPFDSQVSRGVAAWAGNIAVTPHDRRMFEPREDVAAATLGHASCRERVCKSVSISVVDVS